MKKVLSLLLSVMMVAGLFVALIPTATAATKSNLSSAIAPPQYTLGEAWHVEDFEDVDAALTGTDLFNALGWNEGGQTLPSGTTFAVETDEESGNHWVSLQGSAKVVPFLTDDRLTGGDYYIEYTQKMASNTATDGQGLGVVSGGYNTSDVQSALTGNPVGHRRLVWQWNAKERGDLDTLAYFPAGTGSTDICHALDIDTSTTPSAGESDTNKRGSIVGKEIRFRIVIDADYGFSAYMIDGETVTPVAYMSSTKNIEDWKINATLIANYLSFRILNGPVVWVDDIEVGSLVKENSGNESAPTPGLMITEASTDARPAFTATDGATHRFEWIEVYNASTEPKNIYDYAIVRRSGFLSYNTSSKATTNNFTNVISSSEWFKIAYPDEEGGVCVAERTDKPDYIYQFTNPVYAEGVLQPGETAILVNASDWWNGYYNADSLTATTDVFKEEYLMASTSAKGLGYSEEQVAAMKIFNVSAGKGTTCFGMNNTGADVIALAPLADDGSCPAEGKRFYDTDYVESYICEMKKTSSMPNHAYVAGYLRNAYTVASYYSQEYSSFDANGNYLGTGLAKIASKNHSVGTVPLTSRRSFAVTYVSDDVTYQTDRGYLATAYTVTASVPTKAGYTFTGWVDAEGNEVTAIAAADMMGDKVLYATWIKNNEVQWVGYQAAVAEDGKYDLRLIGSVIELTDIKNIAFEITLRNGNVEGKMVYLKYVYKTITADFGESTFEVPNNGYVVVLEIYNCPVEEEFTVQAVTIYEDDSVAKSDPATAVYPY